MDFRYRYVPFGTRFVSVPGERTEVGGSPCELFENELVVDVGGVSWGYDGEQRPILDHHFVRPSGQYPSAAASVLHNAGRVHARFHSLPLVWLVSHVTPDFDALSAMYLARSVIAGQLPATGWESFGVRADGWFRSRGEIDWYRPRLASSGADRWAVLLAAESARVDNGKRSICPPHRTLHAVLYAALVRGRDYLSATSGATEFFDCVRETLSDEARLLDPYIDSVMEDCRGFAPELALLDREVAAYSRDLRRAEKRVVYLPCGQVSFETWYKEIQQQPLLSDDGTVAEGHLRPSHQAYCQADGIFVRDPECLLFKAWARNDVENAPLGQGFLFTAIAYSQGRPQSPRNTTDYFFSLDPERAGGRHLYPVWARLQAEELRALQLSGRSAGSGDGVGTADGAAVCRSGYEQRAGQFAAYFDDPWFDGCNYECTIIATPNRGSYLGSPGTRGDLGDDPVAQVVAEELNSALFAGPWRRFPEGAARRIETADASQPPDSRKLYRFVDVPLDEGADVSAEVMAAQIGRWLWRQLDDENRFGVPADFVERHLVRATDWVAVWNRRGVVIAYKTAAARHVEALRVLFDHVRGLAGDMRDLLVEVKAGQTPAAETAKRSEKLVERLAELQLRLAVPENLLVRRFFQSSHLDEMLDMLRDVNLAAVEQSRADELREIQQHQTRLLQSSEENVTNLVSLQRNVEWVEIGVIFVYATELMDAMGRAAGVEGWPLVASCLLFSLTAATGTAIGLTPWKHHRHGHGHRTGGYWWWLGIGLCVLIAAILAAGKYQVWERFWPGEPAKKETTAPDSREAALAPRSACSDPAHLYDYRGGHFSC